MIIGDRNKSENRVSSSAANPRAPNISPTRFPWLDKRSTANLSIEINQSLCTSIIRLSNQIEVNPADQIPEDQGMPCKLWNVIKPQESKFILKKPSSFKRTLFLHKPVLKYCKPKEASLEMLINNDHEPVDKGNLLEAENLPLTLSSTRIHVNSSDQELNTHREPDVKNQPESRRAFLRAPQMISSLLDQLPYSQHCSSLLDAHPPKQISTAKLEVAENGCNVMQGEQHSSYAPISLQLEQNQTSRVLPYKNYQLEMKNLRKIEQRKPILAKKKVLATGQPSCSTTTTLSERTAKKVRFSREKLVLVYKR